jgi:hypothetical protein
LAWPEEATFALSLEMKLSAGRCGAARPALAVKAKKSAAQDRSETAEDSTSASLGPAWRLTAAAEIDSIRMVK